jgi:hypothetical protein
MLEVSVKQLEKQAAEKEASKAAKKETAEIMNLMYDVFWY